MRHIDAPKLTIIDLFSGIGGWSQPFKDRGHNVITVELESRFNPTICADVLTLTANDIRAKVLELTGSSHIDLILCSPPCETFSIAAISHHRTKDATTGNLDPKSKAAIIGDQLVLWSKAVIRALDPDYFIIENPRGGLRKMWFMRTFRDHATITYCQYGENRTKPTDLWGRFPESFTPRPMCKNGDPCHEAAPRGAKTGTQGIKGYHNRSVVAYDLAQDVCLAVENDQWVKRMDALGLGRGVA